MKNRFTPQDRKSPRALVGPVGAAVIVLMAIIIASPFSYDTQAEQAMDAASRFWGIMGNSVFGFDIDQVRQNVFSLVRDLSNPVTVVDHNTVHSSPMLGLWNFITRGRIRTVGDALAWFNIPLTDKQTHDLSVCTPLDALENGRRVVVKPDPAEYGIASWYGPGFDGELAASGETYSMYDTTAAHKTIPLGSLVRVVSETTGKSVVVRINDRGPYVAGRIIDMSYEAKKELGMIDLARVYLERVNPTTAHTYCR